MNVLRDKQARCFSFFILFVVWLLCMFGLLQHSIQEDAARDLILSHDRAVVSSLLKQGVPEEVVAVALANTQSSGQAADLLAKVGLTEQTIPRFIPSISEFQETVQQPLLWGISFLSICIVAGTAVFLLRREQFYEQAADRIARFAKGDFSCHMPRRNEGTIYRLFASVDQLATALQAKNETEHQAKEFLKNTISDISHQLKTPLAALSIYHEIISNEPENLDAVKEFSQKTGMALERMKQLIDSMLKITRLDAGSIVFEKSIVPISELVWKAVRELTTRAEQEEKEILIDGSIKELLACDPQWTSEAIGNIVKNALDHTKEGGQIRITWERSPAMTRLLIADNGAGIAPEDLHHIFKRFYRSKTSMDWQGVGLGLPLSKAIIEGQGGTISVQSQINVGTTFSLSFLTEL